MKLLSMEEVQAYQYPSGVMWQRVIEYVKRSDLSTSKSDISARMMLIPNTFPSYPWFSV